MLFDESMRVCDPYTDKTIATDFDPLRPKPQPDKYLNLSLCKSKKREELNVVSHNSCYSKMFLSIKYFCKIANRMNVMY